MSPTSSIGSHHGASVERREPRCRSGHTVLMRDGRAASARAHGSPQWMAFEAEAGVEPACTALQAASWPLGHSTVRAPGWIRTSGLGLRRAARFRCATRACAGGRSRTHGLLLYRQRLTPHERLLGVAAGSRTRAFQSHNLACTSGTPQPPYPRRVSNPRPPPCKGGALPLSYTGAGTRARTPGFEPGSRG